MIVNDIKDNDKVKKQKIELKYKLITNPCRTKYERPQMDKINLKEIMVENKVKKERLYCTHCGYVFPKPEIPVNYIITCEKCNRPLELPTHYYI